MLLLLLLLLLEVRLAMQRRSYCWNKNILKHLCNCITCDILRECRAEQLRELVVVLSSPNQQCISQLHSR